MTPDQLSLINKTRSSIKAAQLLQAGELYGFAASRAYYAMFYVAQVFLLDKGLSYSKHSGVISAFGQTFIKTGLLPEKFHRYLIDGQNKRHEGDYDADETVSEEGAKQQIQHAQEFLELAEKHFGIIPPEKDTE